MNEIITFGKGYKLSPGIKVFVKSAKNFCQTLTLIASGITDELREFLYENKVNLVDAEDLSRRYNVNASISPYTLKVIYFYLYCKHFSTASNVYLCDFTDVFIQKDVFELIKNNKPYVTSENFSIGNCDTNTTWLKICYNSDVLKLLMKYDILNGGSILGKREDSVLLLKEMCNDMAQIISRIGNYQNIDQASLNKVVYFDKYRYNILNNFEIFNLAHFGQSKCNFEDSKITVNGKEPYVLHQYDVIKELENYLYVQAQ
jgi:hypothetical protein